MDPERTLVRSDPAIVAALEGHGEDLGQPAAVDSIELGDVVL